MVFSNEDYLSGAILTQSTNNMLTGAQIAALSPTYPGMEVHCSSTSSGFTVDTIYIRNFSNTAWIPSTGGKHLHDLDTEAAGGLFSDILVANLAKVVWLNYTHPAYQEFTQDGGAGGTASNDIVNGRINLATGTTSGGYFQLGKSGVQIDFSKASKFMFKGYCTADTNVSVRMGVAMETVYAATSTSRKYGIEGCDSAGTARNYEVIAANGSTRSNATSTEDLAQSGPRGYRVELTPGISVKFYVNGVLNTTNASNVPSSSTSSGVLNLGVGARTNNTVSKNLFVYGVSMAATVLDTGWS